MREIKTEKEFVKYYCKPDYDENDRPWLRLQAVGMRVYIMNKEEKEHFEATKKLLESIDVDTKDLIQKSGASIGYRCIGCGATFAVGDLRTIAGDKRKCYYCGARVSISDIYEE